MKKNTKKGFTLIELLVVIAIIGILASVVLVNLNDARGKGKDASAISSMSALRSQIELDTDSGVYTNACAGTGALALLAAGTAQGAGTAVCKDTDGIWAASVELGSGKFFCVDSSGFAGALDADPDLADDDLCN